MAGYVNLTGIDIAPPENAAVSASWKPISDDLHADIPAGSVDLILVVEVLEHVENMGALNRLAMMLAPKGRLLVTHRMFIPWKTRPLFPQERSETVRQDRRSDACLSGICVHLPESARPTWIYK